MFALEWTRIGASPWVIRTLTDGLSMDFLQEPRQLFLPPETTPTSDRATLQAELQANLAKAAIERVPPPTPQQPVFYSSQFTVPKRDSDRHRQVSNLKQLNQFIPPVHFKMETLSDLKDVLRQNDWLTTVDIQDAFFHIPLAQDQMDFYRFHWEGAHFRFRAMPFGLSLAPRTFTKVLRPVVGYLRSKGVRCLIYLDDILIMALSREESIQHTQLVVDILHRLGFSVNFPKSQLTPATQADFLGFRVDSINMSLQLTPKKLTRLRALLRATYNKAATRYLFTPRELAALVGTLTATHPAYDLAPLFVRHLRACYLPYALLAWDRQVAAISEEAMNELSHWLWSLQESKGRQLIMPTPTMLLTTDASRSGWGAWVSRPDNPEDTLAHTWGFWAQEEQNRSSNWREATATLLGLRTFHQLLRGHSLKVRTDNQANVAAINHMGTSVPALCAIAKDTHLLAKDLGITLRAQHLPGLRNDWADRLSRTAKDSTDWKLHPDLFAQLCRHWFRPTIDLFATRVNRQVPRFYSYRPDPDALATDAFLQPWAQDMCYANPPFNLVGRTLTKLAAESVPLFLLVAPIWTSQPWWPVLMDLLADCPLLLPKGINTYLPGHLGSALGIGPPSWDSAAFLLSGQRSTVEAFRKRHGLRSPLLFDDLLPLRMIGTGRSSAPTLPLSTTHRRLSI